MVPLPMRVKKRVFEIGIFVFELRPFPSCHPSALAPTYMPHLSCPLSFTVMATASCCLSSQLLPQALLLGVSEPPERVGNMIHGGF